MDKRLTTTDETPETLETWMQNTEYLKTYDILEQEYAIIHALIDARSKAGLTQAQVAARMGISQPAIARIESGSNISVKTLSRYATAVGRAIQINFLPIKDISLIQKRKA